MRRGSRREFRGRSVALSIKKVDGVERMVRKDDAGRTHAWTVASGLRHGARNEGKQFFTPCLARDLRTAPVPDILPLCSSSSLILVGL